MKTPEANPLKELPSITLLPFDTVMPAGDEGAVRPVASEPGVQKILVAGSISVVRQLMAAGLLDELRLLVHPIAARHGERLFDEGEPYPLRLVSSEALPTGVLRLVYAPGELPGEKTYDDVAPDVPHPDA